VKGRARIECWNPPAGIIRGRPRDIEILAAQAKKIEAKLAREEVLLMAEESLVKAQDLEVLARKSLVADSARLKVAISRRVREIVARLEDPSIPVRSAAQTLGSLAPIFRLMDGWGRTLDLEGMELARTGNGDVPTGAVNLELIATTPEQLARRAIANGAPVTLPEQPRAATPGCPVPKKEAPKPPSEGPSAKGAPTTGDPPVSENPQQPPDWFERIAHSAAVSQTPFGQTPQEWHKLRLEKLARQRAEWHGRPFNPSVWVR
jgi:hypothetical protein